MKCAFISSSYILFSKRLNILDNILSLTIKQNNNWKRGEYVMVNEKEPIITNITFVAWNLGLQKTH